MITFIKKIISGQKKLYLGILAVLSLLSSFEFISVVMYSTSNIEVDFANGYILQLVTGIVIMIAFALTLFVNNYIINNKNEEFSLLLLCGRNMKQIIRYFNSIWIAISNFLCAWIFNWLGLGLYV